MDRNILIGIQHGSDCIQQLCALWNNSKFLKLRHQDEPTNKHDMQNPKSSVQHCWDVAGSSPAGRCTTWCGEHSGEFLCLHAHCQAGWHLKCQQQHCDSLKSHTVHRYREATLWCIHGLNNIWIRQAKTLHFSWSAWPWRWRQSSPWNMHNCLYLPADLAQYSTLWDNFSHTKGLRIASAQFHSI